MKKVFCVSCNEITPHVDNTSGMCCQVCIHLNPPTCEMEDWTDQELAAFWQKKYYEAKGTLTYVSSLNIATTGCDAHGVVDCPYCNTPKK